MTTNQEIILSASNVEVQFTVRGKQLRAIRNISIDLYKDETLAIVGESGSGKSVFTKTFTGMLESNGKVTNGTAMFEGKDLYANKTDADWEAIRGKKIATIFQDPMTSLNPIIPIGKQITEVIEKHQGKSFAEAKEEAAKIIARANNEIELERKRALDDMKQEMISIASAMAGKVVAASIDTSVQDELIEETLKEMGEQTWLS